jgi:hypothetical protein
MAEGPEYVSRSAIHKVLVENKREWLWQCFHFAATPQGHDYWKGIGRLPDDAPFPDDAIAYLREVRNSDIPEH